MSCGTWRQPIKWNAKHDRFYEENARRQRVFCASLADVFDNQVPDKWRHDLFGLIASTPNLDWLLLTKRPQNISRMTSPLWSGWKNVWIGTTVENQQEADRRIPLLLQTPAAVRFLSCEPLLGPVNLGEWLLTPGWSPSYYDPDNIHGYPNAEPTNEHIQWCVVGGESGSGARPMHPDWARSLRDQCQAAGVPFLFKQWGEFVSVSEVEGDGPHHQFADGATVRRIGKKAAGRLLDGRIWDEFPGVK
ncbi:phage Gp37/Gp68 family protein [Paenibacillus ginsengarvi]|uniref:phage Gp37/Gp68 family protein n=1 Tax=Paenibacillus ginsengarvi TaxID=400777 RepID=UPI001F02DD27|nr:phage Gp37/Gp68 family protein [Paenibacillus ginsengarvi]